LRVCSVEYTIKDILQEDLEFQIVLNAEELIAVEQLLLTLQQKKC